MSAFVVVLRHAIERLPENTFEERAKIYARARQTVNTKLSSMNLPEANSAALNQVAKLEAAIAVVEEEFAANDKAGMPSFGAIAAAQHQFGVVPRT